MKSLKKYIKEIILQENKKQSNKPPSWVKKGINVKFKNTKGKNKGTVAVKNIKGPFTLVDTNNDGEGDTAVNHDELEKDNEES